MIKETKLKTPFTENLIFLKGAKNRKEAKNYAEKKHKLNISESEENSLGFCWPINTGASLFLYIYIAPNKKELKNTAMHEALHAILYILRHYDSVYDGDHRYDEIIAYSQEDIADQIIENFK